MVFEWVIRVHVTFVLSKSVNALGSIEKNSWYGMSLYMLKHSLNSVSLCCVFLPAYKYIFSLWDIQRCSVMMWHRLHHLN